LSYVKNRALADYKIYSDCLPYVKKRNDPYHLCFIPGHGNLSSEPARRFMKVDRRSRRNMRTFCVEDIPAPPCADYSQ
jgi:hypothetical protein